MFVCHSHYLNTGTSITSKMRYLRLYDNVNILCRKSEQQRYFIHLFALYYNSAYSWQSLKTMGNQDPEEGLINGLLNFGFLNTFS